MTRLRSTRGVSLIEALVALAVMAVGLLGVVGMQASLRSSTDVSRQRAEAVRMAQESMEELRAFGRLDGAPVGEHDYDKIVSGTDTPAAPAGFNTSFSRTVTVPAVAASAPRMKTVQVRVDWLDRHTATGGTPESVTLTSAVARAAPEISASLGLPGDRAGTQRPRGRNPVIPQEAINQSSGGTSVFTPPGGGGATFIFNNTTGLIVQACPGATSCSLVPSTLLSGYVRFARASPQPDNAEAETPTGAVLSGVGISVVLTQPIVGTVVCVMGSAIGTAVPYYCAVPLVEPVPQPTSPYSWTGTSHVTGIAQAADATTVLASGYRVCRYTPGATVMSNIAHPQQYLGVRETLTNQNFLVISAAHTCPTDTALASPTPLVNGNTVWQPPPP